jgi:hypothetical protein
LCAHAAGPPRPLACVPARAPQADSRSLNTTGRPRSERHASAVRSRRHCRRSEEPALPHFR